MVMNNQAASDRAELANLPNISERQLSYVLAAASGSILTKPETTKVLAAAARNKLSEIDIAKL
jgi:hypothetical protein